MTDAGANRLPPEMLAGNERGYVVCVDRRTAIQLAATSARPGDTLLIAGKGHEKYQILGSRREPFDDVAEARAALDARGSAG
jgi:UDP-N-acetylmuramoyl-L-alanyl-D-glutamate--2,6-diaminopimelate ligase